MHVRQEPAEPEAAPSAISLAAALIVHWSRHDIEAVVLMLAEISDLDEAEDIITALLLLRDRSTADLAQLALR